EIDTLNHRTAYIYNALDQRISVVYHDNSNQNDSYDALARRTEQSDPAGISTHYAYDALGRLSQVTDALSGQTRYSYDEAGNKLTQTDAEGRTTSWTYDALGRVLSRTLPLGQQETFAYDANGNLTTQVDFNGTTTTHQYDSDNWLIRSDYANGRIEQVSYDAVGNRTQILVTLPGGGTETTSYTYDARDRLTRETQPDGTLLDYQYDTAGNRTQVRITRGTIVTTTDYSYDSLNRLQSVTDTSGTTSYGYDAVGNRTSVSYPNNSSEVYRYDSLNRLTRKETHDGTGALVGAYDYTLDATGRRTQIDEQSGRGTAYGYDDLYRLTSESITDSQNGNYSASYQYDGVGNRTYSTIDGVQTAYTYDDNDRLTQQGGTSYTYDNNGNTLSEILDTNTITYGYNAKIQLISVDQGGVTTTYGYNADGIRTSKSEGGVTTTFIVDENRDYAQVLIEDDGTSTVSYTYGDDLISQRRNGVASYYHYDGLGSTRSLTDSLGNLSDTYDYEAFGEVLSHTGSTENSYLFAGEQFDNTLNQYYLRARYYDPSQGRFTQQDTWMGNNYDPVTLHKYLYANADPGNMVDPSGNFSLGSFGTAFNILGRLTTIATSTYDVFQIASGEKEFSAKELGMTILFSRLPLKTVQRFLRKACAKNSFEGETLVSTETGLVPITNIKIGDKVWAFNEETGEKSLQEVVHLIQGEGDKTIVDITIETGEVIQATSGHPFYVKQEAWDWIDAGQLNAGDILRDAKGGVVTVESIKEALINTSVYNLTVDEVHTFYVGKEEVLSHNAQKVCNLNGLLIGAKKPHFKPNVKHKVGGAGKKPGLPAGLEPDDSYYAFQKLAVKSAVNDRWYAKSSDGKSIYRYFESNGVAHWSGSTGDKAAKLRLQDIPIEVRRAFGIVK
ncbi:MAG: hypothetical protein KZQ94_20695, partial [Candidatus Thiodiazotropha sp. (ex Troendleina suluensis)]|nr:hypothetical protein [Candidatus Thiodiazotropha sp. (ex Troendleina suluensis)]